MWQIGSTLNTPTGHIAVITQSTGTELALDCLCTRSHTHVIVTRDHTSSEDRSVQYTHRLCPTGAHTCEIPSTWTLKVRSQGQMCPLLFAVKNRLRHINLWKII